METRDHDAAGGDGGLDAQASRSGASAETESLTDAAVGVADGATASLPGAAGAPPARRPDQRALLGRRLGKYVVVAPLGRGGSADVFRAEEEELGRSAVIKVMRADVKATPLRIERFLREAKLASRLDHPYAAHIYAFGAEPDGLLWIAMEHVRGTTLDDLLARRGPMPPALLAPLFERLCQVVHGAHELGIVHRDIKLANVMVLERSGQLLPKLLDFGIAKAATAAGPPRPGEPDTGADADADAAPDQAATGRPPGPPSTGHGALIGTPAYMAPEQWSNPAAVDHRADIYALGVVAYRMLTGRPPVQGETRVALAAAHQHVVPAPIEGVPPALADAVARALEKRVDDRWPSALALGAAVAAAVGASAGEVVPLLDGETRERWEQAGPQPLAEAVASLAVASSTVEVDAALRGLIDITCRWLAAIALAGARGVADAGLRETLVAVWGREDARSWLEVATAAAAAGARGQADAAAAARAGASPRRPPAPGELADPLPELPAMLAAAGVLRQLAARGARGRTAEELAADVGAVAPALAALAPLLDYRLAVGGEDGPELWTGLRRGARGRALLWGDAIAVGEVCMIDDDGRIVLRLTPLVRAQRPVPHADLELFVIWRADKRAARLAAGPWGYERDDAEAGSMLAALGTTDTDTAYDAGDDESPYPGLAAFTSADTARFFGREAEVEALANRLVRAPMVAVVGSSGVGKSSFVHAGLIGRLTASEEPAAVITLRPGRHPLAALVTAVAEASEAPCSADVVVATLRALGERRPRGLLVVVDQLEELVTLCGEAGERERFGQALASAASGPSAPVRVVFTVRDDFAGVLESIDGLRGQVEPFVLGPPSREALRRIVIEPARRHGAVIEAGLVDELVDAVVDRAGALPLLSFTAARLWAGRELATRTLTRAALAAIGGVAGALATYADEVYATLDRAQQEVVRQLFARLVAADGTRVPHPRAELAGLDRGGVVIDRLAAARLLVIGDGGERGAGGEVVEIVHECLAERWPRLTRWRQEDAAEQAILADLRQASRRWHEQGRTDDLLWRGVALADLQRLRAAAAALTDRERAFSDASIGLAQRARRWRRIVVAAVMVTLTAVAGAMTLLSLRAGRERTRAERAARAAAGAAGLAEQRLTDNLIAQARRESSAGNPVAALAYARAAFDRGGDDLALRLLTGAAAAAWPAERVTHRDLLETLVAADGRRALVQAGEEMVMLDGDGQEQRRFRLAGVSQGYQISPDGRWFVVTDPDLRVIDLDDPSQVRRVAPAASADDPRFGPFFLPDGGVGARRLGRLEVLEADGRVRHTVELGAGTPFYSGRLGRIALAEGEGAAAAVRVFDLASLRPRGAVPLAAVDVLFSDDGRRLAVATADGNVHLFDGALRPLRVLPIGAPTAGLHFSPTADRLAVWTHAGIGLYRVDDGVRMASIDGVDIGITALEFDGDDVWTGDTDGMIRRWRGDGALVGALFGPGGTIEELHLTPTSLVARTAGTMRYYRRDALVATALPASAQCHALEVWAPPAARDGRVVVACDDRTLRTWFPTTGEVHRYGAGYMTVAAIAPDRAGERVAVLVDDHLEVYRATGEREQVVTGFALSETSTLTLTATDLWLGTTVGTVRRFDLARRAWTTVRVRPTEEGTAWSLTELADGRLVAPMSDGELLVLRGDAVVARQPALGRSVRVVEGGAGGVLAVLSADRPVELRDGATLAPRHTLAPLASSIEGGSLDPSGRLLALRTGDQEVVLVDARTGQVLVDLPLGATSLDSAVFTADGRALVVILAGRPTLVPLPIDDRPIATIRRDLDCHLALRLDGTTLVPTVPSC